MSRVKTALTKLGDVLTAMVMPNIAAFIAVGLIAALFSRTGWLPNAQLAGLVAPMRLYLLPLLLAFTGGSNVAGHRGGVVAGIATFGVILSAQETGLIAAMLIGPLAGVAVNAVDDALRPHVHQGFEMLVNNFSAGLLGLSLSLLGYWAFSPVLDTVALGLAGAVGWLVERGLLPLANLVIEPSKVLFLNNALNHGILTPLGTQDAAVSGRSLLFLLESNPGPGLGVLLAFRLFGRGQAQKSAGGAAVIQFFGGIHEIYFPYVLMRPALLVAVTAGGVVGTLTFSALGAGLIAAPSPGSIISLLLLTPRGWGHLAAVLAGVASATGVSFGIAALILRRVPVTAAPRVVGDLQPNAIRDIIVTGTLGMGTPALGAAVLRRKLACLQDITVQVTSQPINALRPNANAVYLTRTDLVALVRDQLPESARVIGIGNYLNTPAYDQLVASFKH